MKNKIVFFVALTLLVVMMATAFAATTGLTPYAACPSCPNGIIGVYCDGEINRKDENFHEWEGITGYLNYCNYVKEYYKTMYHCTDCDQVNRGTDHPEYEAHESCGGSKRYCSFATYPF